MDASSGRKPGAFVAGAACACETMKRPHAAIVVLSQLQVKRFILPSLDRSLSIEARANRFAKRFH
jgi:hypothetical protein